VTIRGDAFYDIVADGYLAPRETMPKLRHANTARTGRQRRRGRSLSNPAGRRSFSCRQIWRNALGVKSAVMRLEPLIVNPTPLGDEGVDAFAIADTDKGSLRIDAQLCRWPL
jgi:hypothetical protein